MRRFVVDFLGESGSTLSITGPEARHAARVLRMKSGDPLVLMDGSGAQVRASILSISPREVRVAVGQRLRPDSGPSLEIHLCQALPRPRPMDLLIQKTTELGVTAIHPFCSERTTAPLRPDQAADKIRHWRAVAQAAAKQSGRRTLPQIHSPAPFEDILAHWRSDEACKVLLWEAEEGRDLKGILKGRGPLGKFVGLVGPEGGFTREEAAAARAAGFSPASLGRRILRAETAAIALVALVQYEQGDLNLSTLAPPCGRNQNPNA